MNLVPFLIAKKLYDDQHRRRSSSSSSSKSRHGSSKSRHGSRSSSYSSSSYRYDIESIVVNSLNGKDHLYNIFRLIEQVRPDVAELIAKVDKSFHDELKVFEAEQEQIYRTHGKEAYDDKAAYESALSKTHDTGFSFSYNLMADSYSVAGVKFTREEIENGTNHFKTRYEDFAKKHPHYDDEFDAALAKVEELEKSFLLKYRKKKQAELEEAKKDLAKKRQIKADMERFFNEAEAYGKLTKEERGLFIACAEAKRQMHTHDFAEIEKVRRKADDIRMQLKGYGEKWSEVEPYVQKAVEKAIESLTPEERKMFENLDQIVCDSIKGLDEKTLRSMACTSSHSYTSCSSYSYNIYSHVYDRIYESVLDYMVKEHEKGTLVPQPETPNGPETPTDTNNPNGPTGAGPKNS